ncbi:hypothetical protein BC829DRAFT_390177 [Chytridium lagenaria]|nr:hypothetical protein BC829DRAFT_390177 [Chytridium lagenaria]
MMSTRKTPSSLKDIPIEVSQVIALFLPPKSASLLPLLSKHFHSHFSFIHTSLLFATRNLVSYSKHDTSNLYLDGTTHPIYLAALITHTDFVNALRHLHFKPICGICNHIDKFLNHCPKHHVWIKSACAIVEANDADGNGVGIINSMDLAAFGTFQFQLLAAFGLKDSVNILVQGLVLGLQSETLDEETVTLFVQDLELAIWTAIQYREMEMIQFIVETLASWQPNDMDKLFYTAVRTGMHFGTIDIVTMLLELENTLSINPPVHRVPYAMSVPMLELVLSHPRLELQDSDEFIRRCKREEREDLLLAMNNVTPVYPIGHNILKG